MPPASAFTVAGTPSFPLMIPYATVNPWAWVWSPTRSSNEKTAPGAIVAPLIRWVASCTLTTRLAIEPAYDVTDWPRTSVKRDATYGIGVAVGADVAVGALVRV